ncbi:MAG: YtxH domain-containing protein [Bryobacteraceae bacterium]
MRQHNSFNLLWFLAGVSLGAAVGMLYTPYDGPEMRRRLGEKADEGREALAHSGREYLEKGRELYDKGRRLADEAAEMYDEGRRLVEG